MLVLACGKAVLLGRFLRQILAFGLVAKSLRHEAWDQGPL